MTDSTEKPNAVTAEAARPASHTPSGSETGATQKAAAPPAQSEMKVVEATPVTAQKPATAQKPVTAQKPEAAQKPELLHDKGTQSKVDKEDARTAVEWRVVGETVPGASHLRAGIPNQDALLQLRASSVGLPIILTVSDGHGSNKCFRSDRGSRFAVHLAAELLSETLNEAYSGAHDTGDLKKFEEAMRPALSAELVKRWRSAVEADLRREPLQEAEFARLIEKDGERARRVVEANTYLAYGATLLVVALTSSFALYMQLGDGEILNVSAAGEVTQPLQEDARLLANETTSLCLPNAAEDIRFAVQKLDGSPLPAMIFLTTDGYANSFSTTAGFHQVGGDLIQMMKSDGFDSVNRSVKGWLEEATTAGSGDDCTIAFIVRMDALEANVSTTNSATPSSADAVKPEIA